MDFKLNDEQEEFRKLAKEFGAREMAPLAETCDKHPEKASPVYEKIFESGLINVQLPESIGGLGLGLWDASLINEGLAQGCSGIASAIEYSAIAQLALLINGDELQQKNFLGSMNDKITFGGIAQAVISGENCELTVAEKSGDFVLSGLCSAVLNASSAEWLIVNATDRATSRTSTFVLSAKTRGVSLKDKVFTVGRKAANIHKVEFDNVSVPAENCLRAFADTGIQSRFVNSARVLLASGLVGVAQAAFENAKRYANERQTFGKPIAQHQGIAFMMADMAKDIEAARELTWQAAILVDKDNVSTRACISALVFASEMAMRVTTDAVQVYGGYGYSKEYPVEKLMRDAKAYQCMIPSSSALKATLGQELLLV